MFGRALFPRELQTGWGTELWRGVLALQEHHGSIGGTCYTRAKPSPLPAITTSALGPTCVYLCASFVQRLGSSSLVAVCDWQCCSFVLCVLWARRKSGI